MEDGHSEEVSLEKLVRRIRSIMRLMRGDFKHRIRYVAGLETYLGKVLDMYTMNRGDRANPRLDGSRCFSDEGGYTVGY